MYLLGFPQLEPTNGDGFGAVSPRGNPCRTVSRSANKVSRIPSLLLTSILEQIGGLHCELLEVFRCSVVPKFGDSSYLKPPKCHSCFHPLPKKKKLAPKADVRVCCSGRATSTSVCLSRCSWSDGTLIFGDTSWLIHLKIILRLFPNGPKSTGSVSRKHKCTWQYQKEKYIYTKDRNSYLCSIDLCY